MNIQIIDYDSSMRAAWDEFVDRARQRSFLFRRAFMDYHSDRFRDASLLAIDARSGRVEGVIPANIGREDERVVQSHGGLTYGGLLTACNAETVLVSRMMEGCMERYRQCGFRWVDYKPVPHIYHLQPAEEDLYWLHRMGGRWVHRCISSAVSLHDPLPLSTLRRRKVARASKQGLLTFSEGMQWLPAYWEVLTEVLRVHHATRPVHSFDEMQRLMKAFPQSIRLHVVLSGHEVVAGCVLFVMPRVVHVQYIAASDTGRSLGALDLLFDRLIRRSREVLPEAHYFDFGISTEQGGTVLNEGLVFQKEGFGARGVCYDAYRLEL